MVYGFGAIDYVVVAFATALTGYLLLTRPERVLLFLPTLLTIDFFIPIVTQLTPARIVPIMLGAWLILLNRTSLLRPYPNWVAVFFAVLTASLVFAVLKDDAGVRPIIRTFNYLGLTFTFLFVYRMCQSRRMVEWAITGLVFAALLHGGYSIYQLIAVETGLPFRGIVYSETGVGVAYAGPAGLRINGLADEPKRLSYVLLTGAIAALVLTSWRRHRSKRWLLIAASVVLAALSLLTFSSSYLVALALWAPVLTLLSRWMRIAAAVGVVGAVLAFAAVPDRMLAIVESISQMVESRRSEVVARLDASTVYRQEFYAEDFLAKNPEAFFTGLGIGRYNQVLHDEYGSGVGITDDGGLHPLNSQVYEVAFDFGVAGLIILYVGFGFLFLRLKHSSMESSALAAIGWFLLIQSLFISNLFPLVFVAALIAAYIQTPQAPQSPMNRPRAAVGRAPRSAQVAALSSEHARRRPSPH